MEKMVHGVLESDEDESLSEFVEHIEHSEHLSQLLTLVFLLYFWGQDLISGTFG